MLHSAVVSMYLHLRSIQNWMILFVVHRSGTSATVLSRSVLHARENPASLAVQMCESTAI